VQWLVRISQIVNLVTTLFRIKNPSEGSKTRTYAKDATSQIPSLYQTLHACVGCCEESTGEYYSRNTVKPRILWWIPSSYNGRLSMEN
jgi:hypothetical protein